MGNRFLSVLSISFLFGLTLAITPQVSKIPAEERKMARLAKDDDKAKEVKVAKEARVAFLKVLTDTTTGWETCTDLETKADANFDCATKDKDQCAKETKNCKWKIPERKRPMVLEMTDKDERKTVEDYIENLPEDANELAKITMTQDLQSVLHGYMKGSKSRPSVSIFGFGTLVSICVLLVSTWVYAFIIFGFYTCMKSSRGAEDVDEDSK